MTKTKSQLIAENGEDWYYNVHLPRCRELSKKWAQEHPEKKRESDKRNVAKRKEKDPESFAAKQREYTRQYRERHPDRVHEQNKTQHHKHKEKRNAYSRQYNEEHKERLNEYNKVYKLENPKQHRATQILGSYKKTDRKYNRGECTLTSQWIIDHIFSGQVCQYCGESDWEKLGCDRIDNDLPHTPDNVVCSCWDCNNKRGDKPYEDFVKECNKQSA